MKVVTVLALMFSISLAPLAAYIADGPMQALFSRLR